MTRRMPLTVEEKETIHFVKLAGGRLEDLATQVRCSLSCARKWWRTGRGGGVAALRQERPVERKTGALSRFDPLVAERVLYWKQTHPRRGPDRILATMAGDELLAGLKLPKRSTKKRALNCCRSADHARSRHLKHSESMNCGKWMPRRILFWATEQLPPFCKCANQSLVFFWDASPMLCRQRSTGAS